MTEEEPKFSDKEEAWAWHSERQKEHYESLPEEKLIKLIEAGQVDLFFTLPEAIANKLPKEKAVLALFNKILKLEDEYLVNYHTLNSLYKLIGMKEEGADGQTDPFFSSLIHDYSGEAARLEAVKKLWAEIKSKFDFDKAGIRYAEPGFSVAPEYLDFRDEIRLEFDAAYWKSFNSGKKLSLDELEKNIRKYFDENFKGYAYFNECGTIKFSVTVNAYKIKCKIAEIGNFNFSLIVRVWYGLSADGPLIKNETSSAPWYINPELTITMKGERKASVREILSDSIRDPLGLFNFGFKII